MSSRRTPAASSFATLMSPSSICVFGLFLSEILDNLGQDVIERELGPVTDELLDSAQVRHAPWHVLEAGFVRLVIGDDLDRGLRSAELADALGQRPDADFLR